MHLYEAPLVDSHFHFYTNDLPLIDAAWHRPDEDHPLEKMIKILDDHGIVFGVIAAASMQGEYNDHVMRALRKHKRLRATATLDPRTDIYQMEKMKADGFVGVRLVMSRMKDPPDLSTEQYRAFFRRVADLDWHVHIVDHYDRLASSIAAIEGQGAKLVLDQFARPDPKYGVNGEGFKAALAAIERGRTWVKISSAFRLTPPSSAKMYADALYAAGGAERLVWGSDCPFAGFESEVTYEDTLRMLEECFPEPAVRRKISGETPLRLYFT